MSFLIFNIFSFCLLNYILYKEYSTKTFLTLYFIIYSNIQCFTTFSDGAHSVRMLVDMTSQIKDMENFFNNEIFKEKSDTYQKNKFVNGDIVFKNVIHKYNKDGGEYTSLKGVNLTIRKNEKIALTGHIGSGKSTLIKSLLKLTTPSSGTITIGGVNIKSISKNELYSNIFYIPQKPKLLNRTLYENKLWIEEKNKEKITKIENIMEFMKLDEATKHFAKKWMNQLNLKVLNYLVDKDKMVWRNLLL